VNKGPSLAVGLYKFSAAVYTTLSTETSRAPDAYEFALNVYKKIAPELLRATQEDLFVHSSTWWIANSYGKPAFPYRVRLYLYRDSPLLYTAEQDGTVAEEELYTAAEELYVLLKEEDAGASRKLRGTPHRRVSEPEVYRIAEKLYGGAA
jgi:hypothetical protein